MNDQSPNAKKRVTVVDVARRAGVSPGTVSNAISGKRKVDQETRKRIDAAIAELGYVPNLVARGMRTGRANTIAVFSSMPTAVAAGASKLGFLMEVAASAAEAALQHNMALVLIPPIEDPAEVFQATPLDGAILLEPESDDPFLSLLRARSVPTVVVGDTLDGDIPCIRMDYETMANMLIDHLLKAGATRMLLVAGSSARRSNEMFASVYRTRMARAKLPVRIVEVSEIDAEEGAKAAVAAEIAGGVPFDSVLVPIDAMATGVMVGLRLAGLDVPGDVQVVTRYDGLRARSENPPLTALNLHLDAVAKAATAELLSLIEGSPAVSSGAVPAPDLRCRASSGAPD